MGWRYLHFTCGGLITLLAILRVFVIRMPQTPKWLITQNRDSEAFDLLKNIADCYNRPFSLTLQQLEEPGQVLNSEKSVWSSVRLKKHFSDLFATRRLAYSIFVISLNWFLIGIVSPLYTVYLPYYLASRGADTGSDDSTYITWRNYAINQSCGLIGPIIAGGLVETKYLGRRGTLAVGAAITTALQFGYTQIKTSLQNVAISAAITAGGNIYYSTLYAYTPEVFPSAHRATGYGLCVIINRIGGVIAILIGSYANVNTTAPLFVCASLYAILVLTSLMLPLETRGKRFA
jgi:Major Facilitator Superfamily.